jgi:hypothetical protein
MMLENYNGDNPQQKANKQKENRFSRIKAFKIVQ